MKLSDIKDAVDAGRVVHWTSPIYTVVRDILGDYLIQCSSNNDCIGLTWKDGQTLNGKERDFYIQSELFTTEN